MPRINLLPWRAEHRQERKKAVLRRATRRRRGRLGARLLVEAHGGGLDQRINGAATRSCTTEIGELDKQIEEINGLENQRERLIARMKVIGELQRSRPEVVHLFDEIVKAVPEGVHLTEMKQTGGRIELQGIAQSSTRVSTLMRNIDALGLAAAIPASTWCRPWRTAPSISRSSSCPLSRSRLDR